MGDEQWFKVLVDGKSWQIEDRFWRNVDQSGGCWEWQRETDAYGYGRFWITGRQRVAAHRFSYTVARGRVPSGLLVLHTCDNPKCVRPDHLYLGTHDDNMRDRKERGHYARGEDNNKAKLTADQVRELRRLYVPHQYGSTKLARQFGISPTAVKAILAGKAWGHVQ